jgi:digeranylgeranylglycerophospholipid reductase
MDISIIGAGPIGCYTAELLVRQGHRVDVYEDHATIGNPIQCTGLLTSSLHSVFKPQKEYTTNTTDYIDVFAPNGKKITIKSKEYIINRQLFDSYLAKKAEDAGAVIHTNSRFVKMKKNNGKKSITIRNRKENTTNEVKTDILIGADGANSTVAKILNPDRKRDYCIGIQARVQGKFNPDTYTVYFNNNISPGFFAWIVPESLTTARVGLKGTNTNFDTFLNKHKFTKIEMQAGPIPVYNQYYRTERNKVFLVGDAATQVKATTAGGIIPGMKSAQCLAAAISNNDSYTKRWKKEIGRDLWLHSQIRRVLNKFSNTDWNSFISLMEQDKVKTILEQHDREQPWKLMKALVKEPRLLQFMRYLF